MSGPRRKLHVLVLYDDHALDTCYVREHLEGLRRYSRHAVYFASAGPRRRLLFSLDAFDAVVVHFSIRLAYEWHFSPAFAAALAHFGGARMAMIQDEYDMPRVACAWIRRLRLQCVFTTTSEADREVFYPQAEVGALDFRRVLTGYVPAALEQRRVPALRDRDIDVGYRGRVLPYWYGRLAREKQEIGIGMREICLARGVPHDIEWSDDKRIYGEAWWDFVARCRTLLGTESGSNVVDLDGTLRARVEASLRVNPGLAFEDAFREFIAPHEGRVSMNQVPPKVFEAAALRTGLVLFEGAFSGVLQRHTHYIPLRKDFTNADEVLCRVQDHEGLEAMTERAHRDIVRSGRYSYARLAESVDDAVECYAPRNRSVTREPAVVTVADGELRSARAIQGLPLTRPVASRAEDEHGIALRLWRSLPAPVRDVIGPRVRPAAAVLLRKLMPSERRS